MLRRNLRLLPGGGEGVRSRESKASSCDFAALHQRGCAQQCRIRPCEAAAVERAGKASECKRVGGACARCVRSQRKRQHRAKQPGRPCHGRGQSLLWASGRAAAGSDDGTRQRSNDVHRWWLGTVAGSRRESQAARLHRFSLQSVCETQRDTTAIVACLGRIFFRARCAYGGVGPALPCGGIAPPLSVPSCVFVCFPGPPVAHPLSSGGGFASTLLLTRSRI
jgi:hypothetical protein